MTTGAATVTPSHLPVMLDETLAYLAIREGGCYIDCTTGLGGHSEAIARLIGLEGRLLCIDRDREALNEARARLTPLGRRVSFAHGNFAELDAIADEAGFEQVDGILMDLGVSSLQFDTPDRGFAFRLEGPLDMRMDPDSTVETAGDIVNRWDTDALAKLFRAYGEERHAGRIARAIAGARPIQTTVELARAVEQAVGAPGHPTQLHPATRVFQALRIRVNEELDSLTRGLAHARDLLGFGTRGRGGGRIVAISFHSLEDRIVKDFFKREAADCLCPPRMPECRCGHQATLRVLTRRPVVPAGTEINHNPRSRSAKLRAAERIDQ